MICFLPVVSPFCKPKNTYMNEQDEWFEGKKALYEK